MSEVSSTSEYIRQLINQSSRFWMQDEKAKDPEITASYSAKTQGSENTSLENLVSVSA
jgi:hypothetical protein